MKSSKPETLLSRTFRLVDETDLTYEEVAAGAGVGIQWFAKFKQRCIKEPGVTKVQKVHDFLATRAAAIKVPRAASTAA